MGGYIARAGVAIAAIGSLSFGAGLATAAASPAGAATTAPSNSGVSVPSLNLSQLVEEILADILPPNGILCEQLTIFNLVPGCPVTVP